MKKYNSIGIQVVLYTTAISAILGYILGNTYSTFQPSVLLEGEEYNNNQGNYLVKVVVYSRQKEGMYQVGRAV